MTSTCLRHDREAACNAAKSGPRSRSSNLFALD